MKKVPFKQTAFTLVELLVGITVAAILLTLAVPSIQETIKNNDVESQARDLIALMTFSRSEAIRRNSDVSVSLTVGGGASWSAVVKSDSDETLRSVSNDKVALSADNTFDFTNRGYLDPFNPITFCIKHQDCNGDRQHKRFSMERTGQFEVENLSCATQC